MLKSANARSISRSPAAEVAPDSGFTPLKVLATFLVFGACLDFMGMLVLFLAYAFASERLAGETVISPGLHSETIALVGALSLIHGVGWGLVTGLVARSLVKTDSRLPWRKALVASMLGLAAMLIAAGTVTSLFRVPSRNSVPPLVGYLATVVPAAALATWACVEWVNWVAGRRNRSRTV